MNINGLQNILSTETRVLVLMIGPPLSGKSTIIAKIGENCEIVSRDAIVEELSKGLSYSDAFKTVDQKKVNSKLNNLIAQLGKSESNVIIDMTHMRPKRRKGHMKKFPDHKKVALIIDMFDKKTLFERNKKRDEEQNKFIPESVIESMVDSYVPPTKEEGFDIIIRV